METRNRYFNLYLPFLILPNKEEEGEGLEKGWKRAGKKERTICYVPLCHCPHSTVQHCAVQCKLNDTSILNMECMIDIQIELVKLQNNSNNMCAINKDHVIKPKGDRWFSRFGFECNADGYVQFCTHNIYTNSYRRKEE